MTYSMRKWYKFIRNKVGFLDVYDIGILITGMLSFGVLIGTFFSKTLKKFAAIFGALAALGSAFLVIKVFLKDNVL
jgi:hypothetical protein